MNKNISLPIAIVAVIIAVAGGFFGGMKYQQSKRMSFVMGGPGGGMGGRAMGQGNARFGAGEGNRMAFRPVAGEITSVDETSITVKMEDGSSKIVMLSEKTEITKADQAAKSDLKTGTKVAVFGSTNTDGTVTAQSISVNPIMRMMGERNGTPSASSAPKAQ